jgi:hypothetical protein
VKNEVQHKMAMDAIGFAAQLLTPNADQFSALIDAERSMHSFMHITDPTTYSKAINSKNLQYQVELAKASLAFVRAVQKVKDDLTEDGL